MLTYNVPQESIYPLTQKRKTKPAGEYPREKVASYLSQLVFHIDEKVRPWCEYIATICPNTEWSGDRCYQQEDWAEIEEFALTWQPTTQEERRQANAPAFVVESHPYSGWVSVLPEGDRIVKIGLRSYYKSHHKHPYDHAFATRYFEDLREHSYFIHPMGLTSYAGVLDHGWMFKKRRMEVARELLTALKRNLDRPLYIPGDGIGFYSYIARELDIPYQSSEPAECGYLAMSMGLITEKDIFRKEQGQGKVTIASQLVPFVPEVVYMTTPRVLFDQQRWYPDHPKDLRIIPSTGHRVSYTGTLLRGYQPILLRRDGFTSGQLEYLIRKAEDEDGYVVVDDKALLSQSMLSGFPVFTEMYSNRGPPGWLKAPPTAGNYLRVGRTKGAVDPITRVDVNCISKEVSLGSNMPLYYGKTGDRVFSPYHEKAVQFASIMVWMEPGNFYMMHGAYREKLRYRVSKWKLSAGEREAIRVRTIPDPVVAVQVGRSMYSAEVLENEREYIGGWWYVPVRIGVRVARVQDVKKPRSVPQCVVAKKIATDNWPSEQSYYRRREAGERFNDPDKIRQETFLADD